MQSIGALACAVGSGMFISSNESYIILGRLLAGIGHGFVYMPLTIHCGENAGKKVRGKLTSSMNLWITMSLTILNYITITSEGSGNQKLLLIIFGILFSVAAFIFIPCMTRESPVFLLRKNKEGKALGNLMKLRCQKTESVKVKNEFEDLKEMIQEDNEQSSNIFKDNNLRPLLLVTLSKLFYSLSLHWLLNLFRIAYSVSGSLYSPEYNPFIIALGILLIRTIIAIFPLYGMDMIGRKTVMTVSASLCGVTIIILGIVLASSGMLELKTLILFYLLFDIFSSLGIGMVPEVLASEAFPVTKKSLSITFANTVDALFNLILIIVTPYLWGESLTCLILFGFGSLLLLQVGFFYYQLPETMKMSLRQSRDVLRRKTNKTLPPV